MGMETFFSGATSSAQNLLSKMSGGSLLVVVLEEFSVRGILVQKKRKGNFEVARFLDVVFEQSMDNPRLKLAHFFKKWGSVPSARLLVVTNEFISTQAELPRPQKVGRFAKQKTKATLQSLAQFEIAPFLDYPATQAMVSVYVPETPKGEFEEFGIEESETINATVFAMQKKTYEQIKQVCKSVRIPLIGVMPEEIFAFAHSTADTTTLEACLVENDDAKPRIIVNWRASDAVATLLINNAPTAYQQEFFQGNMPPLESIVHLVETITLDYADMLTHAPRIILGGEGAEKDWKDALHEIAPQIDASSWDMTKDLPIIQTPAPLPARYMVAATATFLATRKEQSSFLVNDYVPLKTRVIEHPLTLPVIVFFVAMGLLALDAAWLEYKVHRMNGLVADVTEQKKELDEEIKKGQAVQKKFSDTKTAIRDMENKIKLVDKGLVAEQYALQAFLASLVEATPPSIQLNSVRQFSDKMWTIEGTSKRYDIISWYVVELKNMSTVAQCRLERTNQIMTNTKGDAGMDLLYAFTLQVIVEED